MRVKPDGLHPRAIVNRRVLVEAIGDLAGADLHTFAGDFTRVPVDGFARPSGCFQRGLLVPMRSVIEVALGDSESLLKLEQLGLTGYQIAFLPTEITVSLSKE